RIRRLPAVRDREQPAGRRPPGGGGGRGGAVAMTWLRHPRCFLAPCMVLILVAIGGRYTLDRAGLVDLAWVDLRVIGLAVALMVLVVDIARRPRVTALPRPEGWLVAT